MAIAERAIRQEQFAETTRIFSRAEFATLEEMPVMRAGWGKHFTTEEMIAQWAPETPDDIKKMIHGFGFQGGFSYGDDFDPRSPEAYELNVTHMTALAKSVLDLRGWNEADLEIATISSGPEIIYQVRSRLEKDGYRIARVRANGFACDGFGAALIDTLANPALQGRPTAIVAGDTLSGKPVPRNNIVMSTLFGNGGTAIAFVPGQDISLVHPDLVWAGVKKDEKGVIKVPRAYDVARLREELKATAPPYYYEVEPGAEFIYSKEVVANQMTTGGETASMDRDTGAVFIQFLTPQIIKMLHKFQLIFPDEKIDLALLHQPSEQILAGIAKRVARDGRKQFPDLHVPNTPWLMSDTEFNNTSPATIGIAMVKAILNNLIHLGEKVILGTIGIGISGHMGVVRFGKSEE